MKKYYVIIAILFVMTVFVLPVSASATAKAGVKPGSFFYFFDKAFERADLFFTFSPENKAKKALENAEERLAEAEESASENKPEAVAEAMENYQENIEVLEKVLNKVPEEAKEAIEKAIEASKERQEEAVKETKELEKEVPEIKQEFEETDDEMKKEENELNVEENKKEETNKKDEQKKEIEKLKKEVEILKQKQITPKQPTLEIQNSQEQKKTEKARSNAEETIKKLATEKLQKEQEEAKIKAEQERLHEVERLADQQVAEEKQKELERQQQLENQRLVEEKAKIVAPSSQDITPPTISQIRAQKSQDTKNYSIEWSTNEPTLGAVNFGGDMSCSINGCKDAYSSFRILKQGESYELNHQIIIDNDFKPATEYKYYIYATDKAGNETGFYDGKIVTEPSVSLPELKGQYNIDLILTKDKSPYIITGDVFINKKLQIEPGVKVKFSTYKLVVNGILGEIKVNGTKSEPVLFELNNSSNGIYIRSNNNNVIDNAVIEFASTRAISIDSEQNGTMANGVILNSVVRNNPVGIWVNNSTIKISNSTISKNNTGVQSVFNSRVEISQSDIFDNILIALSFETGSIPQLKANNIYNNNDIMRIHAHPDLAVAVLSQNNILLENNKGYIYG